VMGVVDLGGVVARTALVDQELVIHLFAPLDGPNAVRAYSEISEIWHRCYEWLGMTEPVPNTGLRRMLPAQIAELPPNQAVAALEDPAADYQMIARREHDVFNVSLVFASPLDTPSRRLRIGSASPPGWIEFDRWWRELSAGVTTALLGTALVFQAKHGDDPADSLGETGVRVRAALPAADQAPYWWQRGRLGAHGFAVWEISPDDERPDRRLAVVAPAGQDPELSAWTWSRGDVNLPPLARYLMHAAKLRYQARVRGNGQPFTRLLDRVNGRVGRITRALRTPATQAVESVELQGLRADEAELTATLADLSTMARTVRIAIDNMSAALADPLSTDVRLARWLPAQLDDDIEYLTAAREPVRDIGQLLRNSPGWAESPPAPPTPPAPPPETSGHGRTRGSHNPIQVRMGFGVDIVGYSGRPAPDKDHAQERLRALVHHVLSHLDLRIEDTDHQGTGDGMNVFLPPTIELHRALPRTISAWEECLAHDNARHTDRIRLRLATVVGPIGVAAIGFSGNTIVEVSRLLNSPVLRQTMQDQPDVDLAGLISDQLHQFVIAEGHPGLNPDRLTNVRIDANEYHRQAWLWVSDASRTPRGGPC